MSSKGTTPPLTSGSTNSLVTPPDEEDITSQQSADGQSETILSNPGPARPFYYLARGHGRFTPLIALDELPTDIKIVNLSLTLTQHEVTVMGGHLCTPAMEMSHEKYIVIGQVGANPCHNDNDNGTGDNHASNPHALNTANIPSSDAINARLARALEGVGPSIDPEQLKKSLLQLNTQKALASNQRYNPTTPGVLGQKVYCTHWMRTGECDFTQQGCMFLHAMPDLDTLELLGFRSYPRWFREMPRQYQIENAKDFNEMGLDHQRHSRGIPGAANWHNQPGRYMPQQGPHSHNFQPYPQQWSNMIPGQVEAISYGSMDGPWRNTGFGPSHNSTLPFRPRHPMPFDHPFPPFEVSNGQAPQGNYPAPAPLRHSIWSRDSSPNMGLVNRMHKPLSPQVVSGQPRFRNRSIVNVASRSPPSPSSGGGRVNGNTSGTGPQPTSLFKVNPPVRGRESNRQVRIDSLESDSSGEIHVKEHSVGPAFARHRSATVETGSDTEVGTSIAGT